MYEYVVRVYSMSYVERVDGLVDCADSDCCQSAVCQSVYEHESDRDRLLRQYGACAGVKEARHELLIHEDRGPLVSLLERTLFMRARDERDPRDKSVQLNFHVDEFHAGYLIFIFLTLTSTADHPYVCSHACSRASVALSRVCCMLISRQASVAGERSGGARGRQPDVRLHRRGHREPLEARPDAERPKRNVRSAQLLLVLIEFLEARASRLCTGSTTC